MICLRTSIHCFTSSLQKLRLDLAISMLSTAKRLPVVDPNDRSKVAKAQLRPHNCTTADGKPQPHDSPTRPFRNLPNAG